MESKSPISNFASIKHGYAFEGKYFSTDEKEHILLTPGNFHIDQKLYFGSNTKYYSGPIEENYILENGDLLVVMTDLTKDMAILGNAVILDSAKPVLHNQRIGLVKTTKDVFKEYLCYLLNSEQVRKYVKATASGTTVRHTSPSKILDVKAFFPKLIEQRKIAKILSTWDKAISTTKRLIDNSKQQKKALMQQLLTGKKRLVDDSGKPFEGEWEDSKLEDISSLMTDYVANGSFQSLRENVNVTESKDYALYVRLVDLRAGLGHSEQKYVDKESFDFLKKSCLHGGELLMANIGANVGEVWQMPSVDLPATLAPNMLMTKFESYIDSSYVYYFLASDLGQNRVSKVIAGSGHPKINKTELKQVQVLLPPLNEQQKIVNVLINADKKIVLLEQQLADLIQEKKALMQQLLTGKRRVRN